MGQRFRSAGMAGQFQQILAVTLLCEVNFHIVPFLRWFLRFTSHNTLLSIIYAPCHARNKDIQSVSNCLTDFFFQILFDGSVRACQLLRAVSREAYSVHSLFGFGHISPLRDSCLTNITSYCIPILVSTRMYFISHFGSKIDMRKVVMLWIRTLVSSNYCESADGRSTNFQKSVV